MLSLNKVFLIGNLTRDPRLRTTPSGISVGEFSIAVNDTYSTSAGERRERTVFVDIVVWKRLAENCYRFLRKGRAALVEGRLEQDTWEDRETGQRRSRLRVVAQNVTFLYRPGETAEKPRDIGFRENSNYRDGDNTRSDRNRGQKQERTDSRSGYRNNNADSFEGDYAYEEQKTEELDNYGLDDSENVEDLPGEDDLPF
ncbi:MAG: single-stranded DNA-binding protein [Planctomycetes bacterium]|nr:single-stranded DNA-binding protein [Planctomycetota bacterium]